MHSKVSQYFDKDELNVFQTQQLTWLCSGLTPDAWHIQDAKPSVGKYHVALQKPVAETHSNFPAL